MQTSESLNAKPTKSENSLESFLEDIFFLNSEAIEELKESFSFLFFKKGAVILTPNAIENELKFVVKGYIREYISSNKKETNINFYGPNDFTTNFLSFTTGKKVITWQKCITPVTLKSVSKSTFLSLLKKYKYNPSAINKALASILDCKEVKQYDFLTKTPKERYLDILSSSPSWVQNIPQYHIASFLQISPETLSRVKKELY